MTKILLLKMQVRFRREIQNLKQSSLNCILPSKANINLVQIIFEHLTPNDTKFNSYLLNTT